MSYDEAVSRKFQIDWSNTPIARPEFLGVRVLDDYPLSELVPYIDWSPFFATWELKGKYPKILADPIVGEVARDLFASATKLLDEYVRDGALKARAVYGFFPANSDGDDVVLFKDDERTEELARFCMLRQQWEREGQKEFRSLADYVAPVDSGVKDYVGAFAVSAGEGIEPILARLRADHDDPSVISTQAIADRLAEAFAERLHKIARDAWGFGRDESLSNDDLIAEEYRGIRPAAGYPTSPDHTEKATLWKLLDAEYNAGIRLTENFAMYPAASVSGLYFANPEARYFAVDLVTKDQVSRYAARKGMSLAEAERWLAPNLGYDPE